MQNRDIPQDKRAAIITECAFYHDYGRQRLVKGALAEIVEKYAPIGERTVRRYFAEFLQQRANGDAVPVVRNKRVGNCGR
jgi:hypothetical protein